MYTEAVPPFSSLKQRFQVNVQRHACVLISELFSLTIEVRLERFNFSPCVGVLRVQYCNEVVRINLCASNDFNLRGDVNNGKGLIVCNFVVQVVDLRRNNLHLLPFLEEVNFLVKRQFLLHLSLRNDFVHNRLRQVKGLRASGRLLHKLHGVSCILLL